MLVVVIVDYRGGWTENVLRDAFFPFWERTKNVLRDTNDFNIDSLMGTKKMSALFRNSQSGVIVDAKVSDRQRQCCAPCRNVIGYKSSFTCRASWFLPSVLLGTIQGEISLFLIMILCYLALAARYSSQLTFHVFSPKRFSASLRLCGGFSAGPKWLFATFNRRVIWAQLFESRLALNPGLNLTRVSRSCVLKHFLGKFSVIFRASNHQLVDKKN